ncbi:DUF2871 domain-containing protein [Streptomyces sp. SCSIO 75703]|uniref:DUF2871 domain-containing protein n=1 Tax=unclassified Streptomyces TaxID=2593676 RepID=UPI0006B4B838|nr:DUF2871 domain-containing protein [Streptomyces sp. TP-A0875]
MKKLYYSAVLYTVLGLAAGLYYRELTKAQDFTGDTQLAVVHTHLLTLGTLVFLITIALQKTLNLTRGQFFSAFFWTYHAGLLLTTALMTVHGTLTVLGEDSGAAISGMAGLGHILLTVALVFFFLCLRHRLGRDFAATSPTGAPERTTAERTHG